MNSALVTGLLNAAAGATGFSAGRVFYGEVDLRTTYPYLLITGVEHDTSRDGITLHETARAQFSVRDKTQAKCQTAGENIQAKFDLGESNITVTGWDVIESDRVLSVPPRKFNNVWVWDMDYSILITKAR